MLGNSSLAPLNDLLLALIIAVLIGLLLSGGLLCLVLSLRQYLLRVRAQCRAYDQDIIPEETRPL